MADSALADQLAAMIADLDGYIARKAAAVAAPVIAAAEEAALVPAGEARAEARRWKDVSEELRRRISALERLAERTREAERTLALALGHHPAGQHLPILVAEAVRKLSSKEKAGA